MKSRPNEFNRWVRLDRLQLNIAIREELFRQRNLARGEADAVEKSNDVVLSVDQLRCVLVAIYQEEKFGGVRSVKGRLGESHGRGGTGTKEASSRGITPFAAR
jgi:hypothetical protein